MQQLASSLLPLVTTVVLSSRQLGPTMRYMYHNQHRGTVRQTITHHTSGLQWLLHDIGHVIPLIPNHVWNDCGPFIHGVSCWNEHRGQRVQRVVVHTMKGMGADSRGAPEMQDIDSRMFRPYCWELLGTLDGEVG